MARSGGVLAVAVIALVVASCSGGDDDDAANAGGTASGSGGNAPGDGGGPSSGGSNSGGSSGPAVPFGDEHNGIATYYAATGEGACMFDASPGDMNVTAINAVEWDGSAWCGTCIDVTGPSGSVRVRVVDLCPECDAGHLDLSREAFGQIAAMELGRVDITWQMVSCEVTGPVSYRYKDGANIWWTAVQVLNHRLPIESMEYSKDDGSTWQPMQRMDYNYFLTESGFGDGSTQVRITAIDGQTLVDELPPVEEYLVTEGTAQFE
jgi:expansin (peptidoglycan-binding protein)